MRTRSVVLATTLTVGLVAGVGSSALAIAFVPGDSSGVTEGVEAIASPSQDPAEGSTSWFIDGAPVKVTLPGPIVIDGGDEAAKVVPAADSDVAAEDDSTADVDTAPEPSPSPVNGGPGGGNSGGGNSGTGNSGQSAEDKAKEDKAKKDKDNKAKKDTENQSGVNEDDKDD